MKLKQIFGVGALLMALVMVLAACGGPAVNDAANQAATVGSTVVSGDLGTTAEAIASDATVQAAVDELAATAEALVSDPTAQAAAGEAAATVEAALSDPTVQAALDDAFSSLNDRVTVTQGQAITFDALSGLSDIQNYRMTVVDAPAGAEASEGQVIKEASGGNISLNPNEYEQYFTTAGDYKVRLDVTSSGNRTATHEFTITMP